ncbi:MAG: acetyl-CoA carboxylase, carboxyltransferase subunit beta [Brevinematales bacterium]|nr:acetyl-CoA carboxylase, carboxyltransferase subunit beta [Brevinematales bacterium]
MAWFEKPKYNIKKVKKNPIDKSNAGLWLKCPKCNSIIYNKEWEENLHVCPHCNYHDRLNCYERIQIILDPGTFVETHTNIASIDPLNFHDGESYYIDKIKSAMSKTNLKDAVITGYGLINGLPLNIAVMDFRFIGGSMGSVVGEKITLVIEDAIKNKNPLLIASASGGARMQEGVLSLMQMAKTSAALKRLSEEGGLYISLLTNPTTGGVTASYAMLGDIIIAEREALIGFAGPRVIEQTIKQKLPPNFQKSEFLLEHGFVDIVVDRKNLKQTIYQIIDYTFALKKE